MARPANQPHSQCERAAGVLDQASNFFPPETTDQTGRGAIGDPSRDQPLHSKQKTKKQMNTLLLRTRFVNDTSSSSSLQSSYTPRSLRPTAKRLARPVLISSLSPNKPHP